MKPQYHTALFFILSATLLFSCCKPDERSSCQGAKNTVIDFTADELNKVPYTGFDTLYFLDQNGDTNIVRGTGKQFYYDVNYLTVSPDCPSNQTEQKQVFKIEFVPIKGNLSFTIAQQKKNFYLIVESEPYSVRFIEIYTIIGNAPYDIDSLKINNVFYYEIIQLVAAKGDETYSLYYNKSHGILTIKSEKDNNKYSLIPKP